MEIITTTIVLIQIIYLIPISIISIRFFRVQFQHDDLVIFQMILRRLILLHMLFACVFLRLSFQLQLKYIVI